MNAKSVLFKNYNALKTDPQIERGRLNRALGLSQTHENGRPYKTTKTSCSCKDTSRGWVCKHQIRLRLLDGLTIYQRAMLYRNRRWRKGDKITLFATPTKSVWLECNGWVVKLHAQQRNDRGLVKDNKSITFAVIVLPSQRIEVCKSFDSDYCKMKER